MRENISMRTIFCFVRMMVVIWCLIFFGIVPAWADALLDTKTPIACFEQGEKYQQSDAKVVNLYGTWHQMGRQYGYLLKDELQRVYFTKLQNFMQQHQDKTAAMCSIAEQLYQYNPYRFREIMQGMSETSGLSLEQIKMTNAVEYVSGITNCSGLAVWQDYARGGLVYGRNYDFYPSFQSLSKDIAVVIYHPADGSLAAATVGYCGEIYAVNGLNEAGLFIELNNGGPSDRGQANDRFYSTADLFSLLFDADSMQYMDVFFASMQANAAYLIGAADGKTARSYEWCVDGVKHGEETMPVGVMAMTNHFVHPDWDRPLPTDETSWNSLTRRKNLLQLAEDYKGQIGISCMQDIMMMPLSEGGALSELTVYQMVVMPGNQKMWLHIIGGAGWVEINLQELLQRKEAFSASRAA